MAFKLVELFAEITAKDGKYQAAISRIHRSAAKAQKSLESIGRAARTVFLVAAGAAGGSLKAFADFEKQMSMIATMLGPEAKKWMGVFTSGIKDMAMEFGESTASLSKGMYDLLSASVPPAKAMEALKIATESAKGGFTTTAVAVDGITSLLNAYNLSADYTAAVSDVMFAGVKRGKINFEQLSGVIGRVAPLARSAGMDLEVMVAALATMTRQGLTAEQASTRLVAVMRKFPAEVNNLANVAKKFEGKSLAEILQVMPESETAAGLAALSGDIGGFLSDIEGMSNATGARMEAFREVTDDLSYSWGQTKQTFLLTAAAIGESLAPALHSLLTIVREHLAGFKDWVTVNGDLIAKIILATTAISGLLMVLPRVTSMIGLLSKAAWFLASNPLVLLIGMLATVAAIFVKAAMPGLTFGKVVTGLKDKMASLVKKVMPLWNKFMSFVLYAFSIVKVAVLDWKDTLRLALIKATLGVIGFAMDVKHFFTDVIPAALKWFFKNWRDIFTDLWNMTKAVFTNLTANVIGFFSAVWNFIKTGDWEFAWTPLLDGFKRVTEKFPEIAGRELTEVEKMLGGKADKIYNRMKGKVAATHADLLKQFGLTPEEGKTVADEALEEAKAETAAGEPLKLPKLGGGQVAPGVTGTKSVQAFVALEQMSKRIQSAAFKEKGKESERLAKQSIEEEKKSNTFLSSIEKGITSLNSKMGEGVGLELT